MTTPTAPGADIDLRALFEKLTAAKYKPQVARGLHLKNPDGSFQVSSIEMEFRAWQDGYRTAVAAVPASEPVPTDAMIDAACNAVFGGMYRVDARKALEAAFAAAHAPVSGMPDLAKLARYDPTAMEEMFGCGDGEYVRLADVEALFSAPQAPDTSTKQG